MVKYRDAARWPRGRGTLLQDSARVAFEMAQDIKEAFKNDHREVPQRVRKNMSDVMLDALGVSIRRAMVRRLRAGGAMSLSKLAKPFRISLPAALKHVRVLEEAGIISTHKRGRVRVCLYNPSAFKSLASHLSSKTAFW